MIIIGTDYHPGFQQIALVDTETGDCVDGWSIARKQRSFTAILQPAPSRYELAWKPVDMHVGSNDYWGS